MCIEEQFVSKVSALKLDEKLAVAVSGGVDSISLLLLMYCWSQKVELELSILTVDHNLRTESKLECQYVKNIADAFGLDCHILYWDDPVPKQNKARAARYGLLTEWCKRKQIKQLLLAHHKNDRAETVLMRLARGSGLDGLCGMQETRYNNGICLVRPLLQFTKVQLIEYVKSKNVEWVEDPSNDDIKYTRTIFRHYISSISNPEQLIHRLGITAAHMGRVKQAMNFYVQQGIRDHVVANKLGYVEIDWASLAMLPTEISMRVLLACIMTVGNRCYKPRYKNFNNLFSRVSGNKFQQSQALHGCVIIPRANGVIAVTREVNDVSEKEVTIEPNAPLMWDNRFRCIASYNAVLCKNNQGSKIDQALPMLKYENKYINPFQDDNCDFQFIFSELVLDVLS